MRAIRGNCHFTKFSTLLTAVTLAACALTPAFSQDAIYAARVSSTDSNVWDSPFYWVSNGGTAYGLSTGVSTAPGTPSRLGCYYHTASTLTVGEGFGLVHTRGLRSSDGVCLVYLVSVTLPSLNASTDLVMSVGSTNCDISYVYGSTAAGGWTNTTAFQAAHSGGIWGEVCRLTPHMGVTQPHIEFKYVSGTDKRSYADCVRFQEPCCDFIAPDPNLVVQAPACTNVPYVTVTGETNANDRALLVYQRAGYTETLIGQLTNGVVLGTNLVPVTWRADSPGALVYVTRISYYCGQSMPTYLGCIVGSGADLRITGCADGVVQYLGGCGARFVLLKSASLGAAPGSWQRAGTNTSTPGAFTIPTLGSEPQLFYRIQCE